jgi:hypothetical protein
MSSPIGKLEPVELRQLWKHEERGFSAWLEANLDVLAQSIGLALQNPERESDAGDFAVDMVVESGEGDRIIIENQLGPTDHDHLGKVITYVTNLDAKGAIWIASRPRPEHIRAVQWLNEISPDDNAFYLVQLAAYRIGSSDPAPLFTLIVGPSAESKVFGKQKKELAERHIQRLAFWEGLLAHAKAKGVLTHAQRSPTKDSWLSAGAGVRSGVSFVYNIWTDGAAVELYIDTGQRSENERIFDLLFSKRAVIEADYGGQLEWDNHEGKRACRVRAEFACEGLHAKEQWSTIQAAMVNRMERLSKVMKPALAAI